MKVEMTAILAKEHENKFFEKINPLHITLLHPWMVLNGDAVKAIIIMILSICFSKNNKFKQSGFSR